MNKVKSKKIFTTQEEPKHFNDTDELSVFIKYLFKSNDNPRKQFNHYLENYTKEIYALRADVHKTDYPNFCIDYLADYELNNVNKIERQRNRICFIYRLSDDRIITNFFDKQGVGRNAKIKAIPAVVDILIENEFIDEPKDLIETIPTIKARPEKMKRFYEVEADIQKRIEIDLHTYIHRLNERNKINTVLQVSKHDAENLLIETIIRMID